MLTSYKEKSLNITKISAEERKKQERMRDVLLLLEQLVEREEITLKLIIDCLYDVGTINFLNTKIRNRPLNRFLKTIIKLPKPLAKKLALGWVKKNVPSLVANWLEGKVAFKAVPKKPKAKKRKSRRQKPKANIHRDEINVIKANTSISPNTSRQI